MQRLMVWNERRMNTDERQLEELIDVWHIYSSRNERSQNKRKKKFHLLEFILLITRTWRFFFLAVIIWAVLFF